MLLRNGFAMEHVLPRFFCYHYFITYIKWDVIISTSLRLLLKVWIWYRCQNRIENYYHHDGEQLGFYKKVHIKTQSRMFLQSLHCKKQRIPINLTKTVLKRTYSILIHHYNPFFFFFCIILGRHFNDFYRLLIMIVINHEKQTKWFHK